MLVPDENLTKCTFLVQRSPHALIDYPAMFFLRHFIHQAKHAREKVDMILKVQSIYYQAFFYESKTKYLRFT